MVFAGIVAGGTGSRMKTDIPKQFLEILGKPVIAYTAGCFVGKVDNVCIACHKDYIDDTKESLLKTPDIQVDIIEGGQDRYLWRRSGKSFLLNRYGGSFARGRDQRGYNPYG